MTTLGAPVKLGCALVDAPCLNHPPIRLVVTAFLALDLCLRHGTELPLLLPHYNDLFALLIVAYYCTGLLQRLLIPTFGANIALFTRVCLTESPTLWTELQPTITVPHTILNKPLLNVVQPKYTFQNNSRNPQCFGT